MTLFTPEINSIEEDILYHETQLKEAQERLEQVKVSQAYSDTVISSLEDFLENTDPFMYEILRGHLNQMFDENKLTLNNDFKEVKEIEDDIEYMDDSHPDYKSIKQLQQEEPDNIAVFHSEEHLKSQGITPVEKEFGPLSYYELTGKPDTRPDTYEDLAPNITYSSSGRAYVGFNDKQEAEKFRDSISEPAMLSDSETMNGFEYEVKFYCTKEFIEDLVNDWTPEQEAELDWQEQLVRCAPDIFYDPSSSKCYMGFSAKGRADQYGSYLSRILDIAEKYEINNKPTITTNTKYELRLNSITEEDAKHLSKFNLKKDYDSKPNEKAKELWRETRKRVHPPACRPSDKLVPLEDIKLGDIVYLNSIDNQYKVLQKLKYAGLPSLEVVCTFNSERSSLVGLTSYLTTAYLVPLEEIQIDPQFKEQEEVLTEDVNVYIPKEEVKKSEELTTEDFAAPPYQKISLDEIEVCDIVSTGEFVKAYYEIYQHNGSHVLGKCLHHDSLPMRIGQDGYYIVAPFLVEKAETSEFMAAAGSDKLDLAA